MSEPQREGVNRPNEVSFFDLGSGWIPLDYLVMVKCIDPKGRVRYRELASSGLHPVEALGMLTTMTDTMRQRLMRDARAIQDWDEE